MPGDTGEALLGELELDLAPARELLAGVQLSVLHDVDVPLCGPDGAAALFGPQKGLRREDVEPFDRALARLGAAFGGDVAQRPGAGAAGGLGAALYALGADARSGCDAVIELVGLRDLLAGAALCLTAEGSVDRQSARGKTVAGVLAACRDAGVPCVVLGGRVSAEAIAPLRALGALDVRAIGPAGAPARRRARGRGRRARGRRGARGVISAMIRPSMRDRAWSSGRANTRPGGARRPRLVCAAQAANEQPQVRFTAADMAAARAIVMSRDDLHLADAWSGGAVEPDIGPSPPCPGFRPKQADLVMTGAAQSTFRHPSGSSSTASRRSCARLRWCASTGSAPCSTRASRSACATA